MKKIKAVLALCIVLGTAGAKADVEMFVGRGTLDAAAAKEMADCLCRALGENVGVIMERPNDRSFSKRVMDGCAPELAVVYAGELCPFIGEAGLLAQGCALELSAKERTMAVRTQRMEKANMAYLLDARAYPAWVPSQMLQALDELALEGGAGMDIWTPGEGETLCLEAFLQGVGGSWFSSSACRAFDADLRALEDALIWLEEMTRAGLIAPAGSREEALERFIDAQTAVFIDWSDAESKAYAREIRDGEIVLLPYPSMSGVPLCASRTVVLCAAGAQTERFAAALESVGETLRVSPRAAQRLVTLETLEGGATLRALVCEAAERILSGEESARSEAARIERAMAALAGRR